MKLTSLVARAFRGLKTARVRTLLTALAIAVGGFVLTLTLAASNGARKFADSIIADNIDPNSLIVSKTDLTGASDFTTPQKYNESESADSTNLKYMNQDDLDKLRQYNFVDSVRESYSVNPLYISFLKDGQAQRYKAAISSDNPLQRPELEAGTIGDEITPGTILISDAYREALGLPSAEALVGQEVSVVINSPLSAFNPSAQPMTKKFKVAGVGKKGGLTGSPLGVYVNGSDARAMSEFATQGTPAYQKYLSADVTIKNGEDSEAMKQAQDQLEKDGFNSQSAEDTQQIAGQIIDVLQGIVFGFGAITLIASVFGVVNTMYISVLERTREIGLMKALGMSRRALRWLFRIEAAWIGFLGGVIGSLVGWGVGSALNPWISKQLDLENHLLVFPLWQIVAMIGVLMLVAMLAGMLPARKAAKLDPVEALRTE